MKFTVNRKIMSEHLKSMIKMVSKNNPIPELNGFLIEANEEDGFLYVTATNHEAAIQRKFKPEVETGGSMVINAHMLLDILNTLNGDLVSFEEKQKGVVIIKCGKCTYTLAVMEGNRYPKPDIPFPDSMVHICNIRQFYEKTCSVTSKGDR